ncbi:MAG TPA: hypothetical protein VIB62_03015 [Actinomycetota bacterium]
MTTWIVVWFVIGICSTILLIAALLFVGYHGLLLGRTARQMSDAMRPLTDDIARAGDLRTRRLDELRVKAERLKFGKTRR